MLYSGQQGLERTFYDRVNANINNYESKTGTRSIMTNFELASSSKNQERNSYDVIKGFFVAPVDGKYQFFMSGDDSHRVYMSVQEPPPEPEAPETVECNNGGTSSESGSSTEEGTNDDT